MHARRILEQPLFAVVVALLAWSGPAAAQEQSVRIRGAIERVDGPVLTIAPRSGSPLQVTLTPDVRIMAVLPAELAAIAPGTFIGTAALPQPDGTLRAQAVTIFPEAMRGAGEGHRPWDLTEGSTMTNATVDAAVTEVAGRELTLTYKGGQQHLVVTPDTPVVTLAPSDASLLVPGNHVFLSAAQQPDGTLTAGRVAVGKDGLVPPM